MKAQSSAVQGLADDAKPDLSGTSDTIEKPSQLKAAGEKTAQDKANDDEPDSDAAPQLLKVSALLEDSHPAGLTTAVSAAPVANNPVPARETADPRPVAASPILDPPAATVKSEPVRDLSFRLGAGTSDQVDVKIQDRAGEIRVAVHSSNSDLSSDMRQQIGDLVGKLDHAGYQTETYKPSAEMHASRQSGQSSDNSQQDLADGRQQQQQQQQSGRQRKNKQPQWLQEMNGSLSSKPVQGV